MKTLATSGLLFLLCLLGISKLPAQIIPYGLYLEMDGKVKFWLHEPNYNGNLDDTVYVSYEGKTQLYDLRNLKYDYLTLVECPDEDWTLPTFGDPSNVNDTATTRFHEPTVWTQQSLIIPDSFFVVFDSTNPTSPQSEPESQRFRNEIRGDKLSEPVIAHLKTRLKQHIQNYRRKYQPDEARNDLYQEFSLWDTVIDKRAVYDYLVDELVFYEYEDEQLTAVRAYHWDSGVEFDSLTYDQRGNLSSFSREYLGSICEEWFLVYDDADRVKAVRREYSSLSPDRTKGFKTDQVELIRFAYDDRGILTSKSILQEDGSWYEINFSIPHQ